MTLESKYPKVELTAVQKRMWTESRTAFLWSQPAFSDIWYNLMVDGDGEQAWFTDKLPSCAGVNGKVLFINPAEFFKYTLNERTFILAHEILHNVYDDPGVGTAILRKGSITYPDGKTIKADEKTLQRAADMRINAALVESLVGDTPADALYDPALITSEDTLIGAYRKVYEDIEKQGGGGKGKQPGTQGSGQGKGNGQGKGDNNGFDNHLKPGQGEGKDEAEATEARNESEWAQGVAAALASARAAGKLPGALEKLLGKVLKPEVDWKEHIRTLLARNCGTDATSWRTLDAELMLRGIGAPGRVGFGAGCIVVARDTSGSVSDQELEKFGGEIGGIIEDINPRQLVVIDCDARVQQVFDCDDVEDLKRKGVKGRGGTNVTPVFDHVAREGIVPDTLIYFTDMEIWDFPRASPGYPVIWASIQKGRKNNPWGEYVDIPFRHKS